MEENGQKVIKNCKLCRLPDWDGLPLVLDILVLIPQRWGEHGALRGLMFGFTISYGVQDPFGWALEFLGLLWRKLVWSVGLLLKCEWLNKCVFYFKQVKKITISVIILTNIYCVLTMG